jgi:hemerythrin
MAQVFDWKAQYAIGDLTIDTQHKHLFSLARRAAGLKDSPNKDELKDLLFKLCAYVDYHFSAEEELMERSGLSSLAEHRTLHQEIIRELNAAMTTSRSVREMSERVFEIMGNWVVEHILQVDSNLKSALN